MSYYQADLTVTMDQEVDSIFLGRKVQAMKAIRASGILGKKPTLKECRAFVELHQLDLPRPAMRVRITAEQLADFQVYVWETRAVPLLATVHLEHVSHDEDSVVDLTQRCSTEAPWGSVDDDEAWELPPQDHYQALQDIFAHEDRMRAAEKMESIGGEYP
ncbi:MAG: hypothetical protein VW362_06150 [Candidatus Nanopelagicales bacterium]